MAEGPPADRAARISHALVCRDRLSPQAARQVMAEAYALDRPISAIEDDLASSQCQHCSASSPEPPQRPAQPSASVRQVQAGYLTGMLDPDG
jgi:hypothetical protein